MTTKQATPHIMKPPQTCWPSNSHWHLLKACLLDGQEATTHWQQWQSSVDIHRLDYGAHRLLPLLYDNLKRLNVEHPWMGKLKGVYRHTWARNQLQVHHLNHIANAFDKATIPYQLIKGTALLCNAYQHNLGLRPMDDIDILVTAEQLEAATQTLNALGFLPSQGLPQDLKNFKHSTPFSHAMGIHLDLHWRLSMDKAADQQATWDNTQTQALNNKNHPLPSLEDQLIGLISHGIRWSPIPPIRWIADVVLLLRHSETTPDWALIVQRCQIDKTSLLISKGLAQLNTLGANIPTSAIEQLKNQSTFFEALDLLSRGHRWGGLFAHYFAHRRLKNGSSFATYLRDQWALKSISSLPINLVKKCFGRFAALKS